MNGVEVFEIDRLMQKNIEGNNISYRENDKIVVSVEPPLQQEIVRKIEEYGIDATSYFVQHYYPRDRFYTIDML